ncbi:iron-sulfur cluster biosynthesis family protein [Bacillus marinisedimentorum]|uniref:iron-sulfur cluster biosynthesis family protein n=1 Tax=Bacillus marinisedimentorum TaxID=1821260 RepID=UPI000871EBD6|nr:iron-sulfur cluster biosynthesis family protein [Bacillus marinisedimentorum]
MKITVSECAAERLAGVAGSSGDSYFKLIYDTEGCGCGVDGTAALTLTREKEGLDEVFPAGPFTFLVARHDMIYFDERLTIDCRAGGHSLLLKSPERIITPNLNLRLQEKDE